MYTSLIGKELDEALFVLQKDKIGIHFTTICQLEKT